MILADASRRGFLDLVSIRLPTICIRPGAPNKAASSFVSSIVREPLLGLPTTLPVPENFAVWIASPAHAVAWLLHAAAMDTAPMGLDRGINPPGLSVTTGAMLRGVVFGKEMIETETVVMRSVTGTVRYIKAEHRQLEKFHLD